MEYTLTNLQNGAVIGGATDLASAFEIAEDATASGVNAVIIHNSKGEVCGCRARPGEPIPQEQ